MAKYLDEQGLRTLWGKIKERDTNVKNEVTSKIDTVNSQLQGLQGSKVDKVELDNYYAKTEVDTKLGTKLDVSKVGANGGVATLGSDGKVPSSQLPSYVDDVLEYDNKTAFPKTGEGGKIYISKNDNKTYRWSGSAYVEISASLALGETVGTAYAGDKGKKNADDIGILGTRITNVNSIVDDARLKLEQLNVDFNNFKPKCVIREVDGQYNDDSTYKTVIKNDATGITIGVEHATRGTYIKLQAGSGTYTSDFEVYHNGDGRGRIMGYHDVFDYVKREVQSLTTEELNSILV